MKKPKYYRYILVYSTGYKIREYKTRNMYSNKEGAWLYSGLLKYDRLYSIKIIPK